MGIVVIAILVGWLVYAVRSVVKGKTGCCGDCMNCSAKCEKEKKNNDNN